MDIFYVENRIHHNFLAPITPQQNGVVERTKQNLVDIARTMLIDFGLLKNFWDEVENNVVM